MSAKYENLLSPIKIGNVVFRNRLIASMSKPHFFQGSEPYPNEAMITHYANKARNGAAIVTCRGASPVKVVAEKQFGYKKHRAAAEGGKPVPMPGVDSMEVYFSQMSEAIHFYGAKASMGLAANVPPRFDVSAGPALPETGDKHNSMPTIEIPSEMLDEVAEDYALQAALMKDLGFDMVHLHMTYRAMLLGRFISPLSNKRTDQFGGSRENMARFPLMVFDRIKQKCGKDFLIEASLSGSEPEGGLSINDVIKYAKMFEGHIDMLQLRAGTIDPAHPTGFNRERTPFLYMAEAMKNSGVNIPVVTIGGYQDLDFCEEVIASGKADFIGMARSWVSNPDYGLKAYEGRGEDVVPCVRCNKCHISSFADPWASVCSVNPAWEFEYKIERMIQPPAGKKKAAVIGGGPAGMEAALVLAGRGHEVTLYEQSDALGGLLRTADDVSFKWPVRNFKDYLIRQIEKSNVKVRLNTDVTPKILKKEKYDAVFAAVGSEPVIPDIPGVNGMNVVPVTGVFGNEDALAEDIVIIGGGEVGVETGMHLAEKGHNVIVLEKQDMLAPEATPIHYYSMFREAWEKLDNFKFILNALCIGIGIDKVTYIDAHGKEHTIKAGSVVIAVGMKAKSDLALKFYGSADRFFIIGDCDKAGNIQKVMRSAFGAASML